MADRPAPDGRTPAWLPGAILATATAALVLALVLLPSIMQPATSPDIGPHVGAAQPSTGPRALVMGPPEEAGDDGSPAALETPNARTLPPTTDGEPGRLETIAQKSVVWEDRFGAVRVEVIATVRNTGGAPVEVAVSNATWAVSDDDGNRIASGRFAHAFPSVLEAGAQGYLIDGVSAAFAQPEELAQLEVEIPGHALDETVVPVALNVADLEWIASTDGGLEVSGRVENPSPALVEEAKVAVVLKDVQDDILCAVYDVAIGPLGAGESRSFDTAYPGTPPVSPGDVAAAEAIATGVRDATSRAE